MNTNLNSLIKEHIDQTFLPKNKKVYDVDIDTIREEIYRSISSESKKYKSTSGLKKAITQKAKQIYLKIAHGDIAAIKDKESFLEMLFRSSTYSIKALTEKHLVLHKCKNKTCPIKYFNTPKDRLSDASGEDSILSRQPISRRKCAKCINQVFDNPNLHKYINQSIDAINNIEEVASSNTRSFPRHIQKHIEQNMKSNVFNFNTDHKTVAILYLQHMFDNDNNFVDYKKVKINCNIDTERYRTAGQVVFNMGYIHQQDLSKVYQKELNNGGLIDCVKGVQSNRAIGAMIFNINSIKKKLETYKLNKELRPENYQEMMQEIRVYQKAIEYFSKANQTMTLKELINEFRSQLN